MPVQLRQIPVHRLRTEVMHRSQCHRQGHHQYNKVLEPQHQRPPQTPDPAYYQSAQPAASVNGYANQQPLPHPFPAYNQPAQSAAPPYGHAPNQQAQPVAAQLGPQNYQGTLQQFSTAGTTPQHRILVLQ